ncbi:MAG TPA: protein TolR [Stellaceae bacterium]|nr:protein TolR [Stellaceae bacterium]
MAGALFSGKSRGRASAYRPMSEINVTPMVDVMLVLLIIFMVTAPLLTVGVPVDLPQTEAPSINEQTEPLAITVNAQGKIFLQDSEVTAEELAPKLGAITNHNPDARIYVRGDKAINYGRVLEVLGLVIEAGYSKATLVAELPRDDKAKRR